MQGFKDVLEMNDIVKAVDSKTRVLVASIASASDVTQLASQVGSLRDPGLLIMSAGEKKKVGSIRRGQRWWSKTSLRRCSFIWVSYLHAKTTSLRKAVKLQ